MTIKKKKKLYEGKAKILYSTGDSYSLIQHFKDEATAFNAKKKEVIEGKGVLNNFLSEFFMQKLNSVNVPTHFISRLNMREQLVEKCDIIPLEVVIRNIAAGSLSKRLGIEEGKRLPRPLVEFYYKDDSLNDPLVTESQISTFEWATETELGEIFEIALRTNDFLCGLLSAVNLLLVDFKIEIGRSFRSESEKLIIADEISPDTCRLWDSKTKKRLDKDDFRLNEGSISIAYTEVADRFDLLPKNVRRAVQ